MSKGLDRDKYHHAVLCSGDTCNRHGKCKLSEDYKSATCQCEIGWFGDNCQVPGPCGANGNCQPGVCVKMDGWGTNVNCLILVMDITVMVTDIADHLLI